MSSTCTQINPAGALHCHVAASHVSIEEGWESTLLCICVGKKTCIKAFSLCFNERFLARLPSDSYAYSAALR